MLGNYASVQAMLAGYDDFSLPESAAAAIPYTAALLNVYVQCAKEIYLAHPKNLPMLIKQVIFNEFSKP